MASSFLISNVIPSFDLEQPTLSLCLVDVISWVLQGTYTFLVLDVCAVYTIE